MANAATVDLWSDWQCNGGIALGRLRVIDGTFSAQLDNTDQAVLTVLDDARLPVSLRQVLRITDYTGVVFEYRVQKRSRTLADSRRVLTAFSPIADLATSGLVRTLTGGVTTYAVGGSLLPVDHIATFVLANASADGVSWLSAGTITPAVYVNVVAPAGGYTRLAYLNQLVALTGAELRLRRNGATGYYIDLVTTTGGSAAAVHVRQGRNLLTLQEDADDTELATAVTEQGQTPSGALQPAGIGENAWTVGTITGAGPYWVPLADPAGGAAPIAFASQFGTATGSQSAYLLLKDATLLQITDSRITPDYSVSVAATTGLTAGDLVQLVADSSGNRLTELRAPSVGRLHRVDVASTMRGERNLARNGLFSAWGSLTSLTNWTATNTSQYARNTPSTFSASGTRANTPDGGSTWLQVTVTGGPANGIIFQGDRLKMVSTQFTANATVQLDGSGAGTLSIYASALPVGTGNALSLDTTTPSRPATFPDDGVGTTAPLALMCGAANDYTWPPTTTTNGKVSATFRVKYLSQLSQLTACTGWTQVGYVNALQNKDSGGVATLDPTLVAKRNLPGMAIMKGASVAAYVAAVQDTPANSTAHYILSCQTTVTTDTDLQLVAYPGPAPSGVSTPGQSYCRYAMLWLGSSEVPSPPVGDASYGGQLWQRANRALTARSLGARQITVSLRNLSAAAGYDISRDQLVLGGSLPLDDLGITVRGIGLVYKATDPTDLDVVLDSRPRRLAKFLAELR